MDILSTITNSPFFKFAMKYKFTIILTIIAFNIFILALFIIYRSKIYKHIEGYTSDSIDEVNLIMFHVDWCPHCKTAMPSWNKIVSQYNGVTVNNKKINVISLDSTDENNTVPIFSNKSVKNILNQFNINGKSYSIDGYPTIILADTNNNIIAEFNKSATYENIENFINETL